MEFWVFWKMWTYFRIIDAVSAPSSCKVFMISFRVWTSIQNHFAILSTEHIIFIYISIRLNDIKWTKAQEWNPNPLLSGHRVRLIFSIFVKQKPRFFSSDQILDLFPLPSHYLGVKSHRVGQNKGLARVYIPRRTV